jgi:hypothetical protein
MLRLGALLSLMFFTALSAGCTVHRDLRLTEIGKNKVELYLDEPTGNSLTLVDHRLIVNTSDNLSNQLDLSILGRSLTGGEFLIVWEDANHSGPPVAANFPGGQTGAVTGIKVAPLFFHDMGDKDAAEVRLRGNHSRGAVTDKTDDCVRFGISAQRPRTGGAFTENGSLGQPRGSFPLQRLWDPSTDRPIDTDREEDWVGRISSWGVKTN